MHLTSFTDYTLRVLIYLGVRRDETQRATISDIADAYGISMNHLRKVVHHLAKEGILETTRGQGGGLRLARSPAAINIGEIVRASEENTALVACFQPGTDRCPIQSVCELQHVLSEALDAFYAVMDRYTLADLIKTGSKYREIFRVVTP